MDILQLVLEAFVKAPIFLAVPLLLLVFVVWSPWSPAKFYAHHDHEHPADHVLSSITVEGVEPEFP